MTSWASSSSTPGSAASDDQWSSWNECQVCLPKTIHPASRCSRQRGPPQSDTTWLSGGTIPARGRCNQRSFGHPLGEEGEFFHHVGRIASLVRWEAPYAKIAVMVDSDPSVNAKTVDTVSDLFRVRPLQVCPGPLSPAKRPRLFWLSWRLQACAYGSWWAEGPLDVLRSLQHISQKKSAGFTSVGRARRSPRCQRSPNAFRYNASPVFHCT